MPNERTRTSSRIAVAVATTVVVLAMVAPSATQRALATSRTASSLAGAQSSLNDALARIRDATGERDRLAKELGSLLADVDASRRQIETVNARLVEAETNERELRSEVDAQQARVDAWAANAYMNPLGSVEVVLGATSFDDLQSRLVYLDAVSTTDRGLIDGLSVRTAALRRASDDLDAMQASLRTAQTSIAADAAELSARLAAQNAVIASLATDVTKVRALVGSLQDRLARERALAALRAASPPAQIPAPPRGSVSVTALIGRDFRPLGAEQVSRALCVAYHESRYDPAAVNVSSGAAGIFQFMPQIWPPFASAAGWSGASPLNLDANVAVAAWTVAREGWSPWRADAALCNLP